MKKTVQVIMLPTTVYSSEIQPPIVSNFGKLSIINNPAYYDREREYQHLHFTSNEEIKEGDKFIWKSQMYGNTEIYTFKEDIGYGIRIAEGYIVNHSGNFGKVIATTDKSLNLPLIPQSFIEEYVKNKGEIKEVDVEFGPGNIPIVLYNDIMLCEKKKQTLEEAAIGLTNKYFKEKYGRDIHINRSQDKYYDSWDSYYSGLITGAKWQQSNF